VLAATPGTLAPVGEIVAEFVLSIIVRTGNGIRRRFRRKRDA
jgi:hypothetical protein